MGNPSEESTSNASTNLENNKEQNEFKQVAAMTSCHGWNNQATDDEDMEPTQYLENWLKALKAYKKAVEDPPKFEVTMSFTEFIDKFAVLNDGARAEEVSVSLAGQIFSKSVISKNMFIYYLHGAIGAAKVLLMADARTSELDEVEFYRFHAGLKHGDIIGVTGFPGKFERGELSIYPKSIVILSRCLMMPRQEAGPASEYANNGEIWIPGNSRNPEANVLGDQGLRYCQSYLDLMLNAEIRHIFKIQSKVISYMRKFLDNLHFSEVAVPTMNMIAGGAAARPFVTHHNVQNMDHVYEIRKQFRSKGIDLIHNPEFTTCGFYRAYVDYEDLMQKTEDMLSGMVRELTGGYIVNYHANGLDKDPIEINFTPPFRRLDMIEELEKMANLKLPKDLSSDETTKYLIDACAKYDVKCSPPQTTARLLDKLVGHFLEDTCVNPTFVINHPEIMSPFAKSQRSKPGLTQRFELFVFKLQLCNGYTELNDPTEAQREQFEMVKHALLVEHAKLESSNYWKARLSEQTFWEDLENEFLPPIAACGLGIDILTMLLTGSQNIKEVLL